MPPTEGTPSLPTWYLFLRPHVDEPPSLIKRCQAETPEAAATVFAGQLNSLMGNEVFLASELLPAIKREDALTETESHWLQLYAPELLDE
jgi:hypothetical protein